MKAVTRISILVVILFALPRSAVSQESKTPGYILELEKDIGQVDSVHFGGGIAIGYSFFDDIEDFHYVFRKRVLKPGAEIQFHLQEKDEIYYILRGTGEMKMNDETFSVKEGYAILTRAGSSHGLKQTGDKELALIIVYEKE